MPCSGHTAGPRGPALTPAQVGCALQPPGPRALLSTSSEGGRSPGSPPSGTGCVLPVVSPARVQPCLRAVRGSDGLTATFRESHRRLVLVAAAARATRRVLAVEDKPCCGSLTQGRAREGLTGMQQGRPPGWRCPWGGPGAPERPPGPQQPEEDTARAAPGRGDGTVLSLPSATSFLWASRGPRGKARPRHRTPAQVPQEPGQSQPRTQARGRPVLLKPRPGAWQEAPHATANVGAGVTLTHASPSA